MEMLIEIMVMMITMIKIMMMMMMIIIILWPWPRFHPQFCTKTVLFAMAAGRSSAFIPVFLEMVSGKVSFLLVEAFQRRMSDRISPLARNACPAN